ncbi:MAG: thymidine phosphorylase [Nanoarchaeota archaeon]
MRLKIKLLKWSAGLPVVILDKSTAQKLGVHAKDRILIKTLSEKPLEISTIVDITEGMIKKNRIAISSELHERYDLKNKQKVEVSFATYSKTLEYIKKKLNGKTLNQKEINLIVSDISKNALSEAEIALFISAMYQQGMNFKETINLIKSMSESGNKLKLNNKLIVDKHSIGGIPGNRTTPIVVAICSSLGLIFPKNSSRAITSAAGTADVIGAVAKVSFSIKELKKIINKTSGCLVWGGALGLVPVDTKLIQIEKSLNIDPRSQLLASIFSKKIAAGSTHILIDIPYGNGAKVSFKEAQDLKKDFEKIARHFKKKIRVVLTLGNKPIGKGVGPLLELSDVLEVLKNSPSASVDLREKSIFLAGQILELSGKAKKGKGEEIARKELISGRAFSKFKEIITEQKGNLSNIKYAKYKSNIKSYYSGKITRTKNKDISILARLAGAPTDIRAGIYLHKKTGDKIKKGDILITIYSESLSRLKRSKKFFKKARPLEISKT